MNQEARRTYQKHVEHASKSTQRPFYFRWSDMHGYLSSHFENRFPNMMNRKLFDKLVGISISEVSNSRLVYRLDDCTDNRTMHYEKYELPQIYTDSISHFEFQNDFFKYIALYSQKSYDH